VLALAGAALPAAAQTQAVVSGDVTGHDGTPVAGVVVRLEPKDNHGTKVEAKTNKKGHYLIGMVRSGAYSLKVLPPGDAVLLHMKGKGTNTDDNSTLWEADQAVSGDPDINVGARNKIELDLVVGPKSATPQAKTGAAADSMSADYDAAVARISDKKYDEALALLKPISEKRPDHANTWYLIGFSQYQLKNWDESIAALDKALAIEPTKPGVHLVRGRALKAKGSLAEAEAEYRKEIDANGDPSVTADAWVALGVLHSDAKRLPDAAQDLEQALTIDPNRREVILELSRIYTEMGDRQKAAATLERAEKAGGMDDAMLLNLAIGAINDKKYDEAAELANRLLAKGSTNPNLSMAHSVLARVDLNKGNMAGGKQHLEKAIELDPNSKLTAENREILASLKNVK
jgi:tetratricopeptide (TPR) repeat protein